VTHFSVQIDSQCTFPADINNTPQGMRRTSPSDLEALMMFAIIL
jgi:hypothetical protein